MEKVGIARVTRDMVQLRSSKQRAAQAIGGGARAVATRLRDAVSRWLNPPTPQGFASASYRFLARHIQADLPFADGGRVILLSSATSMDLSGESLLMLSFFLRDELGCRILLLDGTLREGGVGAVLGHEDAPGFLDLIYGTELSLDAVVQKTNREHISVLPAGRIPAAPLTPTQASRIAELLKQARASFDYILIQQGPIFQDSRYLLLTSEADLILLLVEESETPLSELERCVGVFRDHQVGNVRIVLAAPR